MAEEVKLPQLGESVTEGTITAWLVNEGEDVTEDQPLFEISTEKVDTEVPSPASGVLKEIRAQVDDTIEVGDVVAIIETEGEAAAEAPAADEAEAEAEAEAPAEEEAPEQEAAQQPAEEPRRDEQPAAREEPAAEAQAERAASATEVAAPEREGEPSGDGQAREELLSPIVRRLVEEHDIDVSRVEGTGKGGRITRQDVERVIQEGAARRAEPEAPPEAERDEEREREPRRPAAGVEPRQPHDGVRGRTEKLSRVRASIARSMFRSIQTTAQLTAAREVDVSRVMQVRAKAKDAFRQREGVPLSPLPFIARAVCMVLPRHESLNASIDVDEGVAKYYETINLGVAVDAPQGLIVPNIKDAQDLTVPALARAIADVADRVRNKKLNPDDVQGGTFTITNTGSRGVLFDTPVLNPPESGILATPVIEKRPVVRSNELGDEIAIRWMTYLCLTYDHRMVDGADAARFLADLAEMIETHDWSAEVSAY
ncbi:MAG: 2-oxo acid dehydrogenase subunit E2 [Actinomycetota bacterium]|nr:2-oxo acid dehydrogenase subunit E2 [Actinomycetota bacterium]